jgi:hypothetical protein
MLVMDENLVWSAVNRIPPELFTCGKQRLVNDGLARRKLAIRKD